MTDKLATKVPEAGALTTIPDDLLKDAGLGTQDVSSEDLRPPRLRITQAGSPQRKPDNEKQIAGLNELDMFNDLTGEIYGRGPLPFIVIKALPARGMQFAGDGKSVLDFDVPLDDPRMRFTNDADGNRVKPIASKFLDFLIWLPESYEMLVLSLSSTLLSAAVKINGLMNTPLRVGNQIVADLPAWTRTMTLSTKPKQSGTFNWGIFVVALHKYADGSCLTPPEIRANCKSLYLSVSKKRIAVDHDETDAAESGVGSGSSADTTGADNGGLHEHEDPTDM